MQKNNALLKSKAIGSAVITSGGVLLMFSTGWQLFSIGGQTYLNYLLYEKTFPLNINLPDAQPLMKPLQMRQ